MRQYIIRREKCDVKEFLLLFLRVWGFSQGWRLINHFRLWQECPIFSHVLERPTSPTDHIEAKGISAAPSQPSPCIPSSLRPLFTCCPGDSTATETTHCYGENGDETACNPPVMAKEIDTLETFCETKWILIFVKELKMKLGNARLCKLTLSCNSD